VPGFAQRFGYDVERLLEETPPHVFEEWRTLYGLEPWGDERADLAAGTQIMYAAAFHGGQVKEPAEYMHHLRKQAAKAKRPATENKIKSIWRATCKMMADRKAAAAKAKQDREGPKGRKRKAGPAGGGLRKPPKKAKR
jgi:hypothetical protein